MTPEEIMSSDIENLYQAAREEVDRVTKERDIMESLYMKETETYTEMHEALVAAEDKVDSLTAIIEKLTKNVNNAEIDEALKSVQYEKSTAPFNDDPLYVALLIKHILQNRFKLAEKTNG